MLDSRNTKKRSKLYIKLTIVFNIIIEREWFQRIHLRDEHGDVIVKTMEEEKNNGENTQDLE